MTLAPARPADLDPARLLGCLAQALPLTFQVDGEALTYRVVDGQVLESAADDGDTVVRLSPQAWTDVTGQYKTFINLLLSGELDFVKGSFDTLAEWLPALAYLHGGIPPYRLADLKGRDPGRTMSLDEADEELAEQLQTMGYLHLRGVFSADEMAAANAEIDRLAAQARPGDDQSWWVQDENDQQALCRLVYASQRSELLRSMENDPRITRLGTLLDPASRPAPDRMEGTAVLIKVPGKTKGLSNIPWHQDCGMGGHAIFCPATSIGIQLTGSTAGSGNLLMVPGSHGQTLHYQWEKHLTQAPRVEIDTAPGDVTVHIQDVMHASPRPTGAGGRRTMYVTHYPATLWDHIGPGEAYNDLVRNRTAEVAQL